MGDPRLRRAGARALSYITCVAAVRAAIDGARCARTFCLIALDRQLFWRIKRPREQRAVRSGRWKLVQDGNDFYLFDLSDDPGERHDLTAEHPELVRKLNAALDQWEKSLPRVIPNPAQP